MELMMCFILEDLYTRRKKNKRLPHFKKKMNKKAPPFWGEACLLNEKKNYFVAGVLGEASFTGDVGASGTASIFPLIRITFEGSLVAFEVTVTDLLIGPTLLESYFTLITPVFPGAIGSLDHSGTVHPQEP